MKAPIVIIGQGEMGGVFARGFLRLGRPVYPVVRGSGNLPDLSREIPLPELVLVAVGEADLGTVLDAMPAAWRDRIGLLQNELLPRDFAHLPDPTVISAWFEKKGGREAKVIIPSPVYGPGSDLMAAALAAMDVPARRLDSADALLFELVVKNLYILTSNIAGLRSGGTVNGLWTDHRDLARDVAGDVIAIQEALTDRRFDHERLIAAMLEAFDGDPEHQCKGRSAPARLTRALEHADKFGLEVPTLRAVARDSRHD